MKKLLSLLLCLLMAFASTAAIAEEAATEAPAEETAAEAPAEEGAVTISLPILMTSAARAPTYPCSTPSPPVPAWKRPPVS